MFPVAATPAFAGMAMGKVPSTWGVLALAGFIAWGEEQEAKKSKKAPNIELPLVQIATGVVVVYVAQTYFDLATDLTLGQAAFAVGLAPLAYFEMSKD